MKTTINIHLAQRLLTLDTDAWQRIENYLNELKKYFKTQESGDEIYTDIENRISEIMDLQLKSGKVSINDTDAVEIINKIGDLQTLGIEPESTVNDIPKNENANQNKTNSFENNNINNTQSNTKRLTRNGNDKIISGLCSGIANYINTDPVWVRLFFFLFIGAGGIGFILYILGTIIIPKSYDTVYNNKRLFRNIDDKMIAGVCSGIGAYLNVKPIYIRLIFLSPIILGFIIGMSVFHFHYHNSSFGFANIPFFGTYLLLVFIMPKAITPTQKLQMRGELVNVNTIRNQVYGNATSNPINTVHNSTLGSVLVAIIKGFCYCILGFFLFVFVMVFIGLFSGAGVIMHFSDYLFTPGHQTFLSHFGWFLFCGAPIAFVVALIVKKVSKNNPFPNHIFSWIGLSWIFGLFCLIALSKDYSKDFLSANEKEHLNITLNQYPYKTMRVKVVADENEFKSNFFKIKSDCLHLYNDSVSIGNVTVEIAPSTDSFYHLQTIYLSKGANESDVEKNISMMQFNPIIKDSTLLLPMGYVLHKGQIWRGQKIKCKIFVPEGKNILLEKSVEKNYSDIDMNINATNFSFNTIDNFKYVTDSWYKITNGKLDNPTENNILKAEKINEINDEIDEAKQDIKDATEEATQQAKEALDNANEKLSDLQNNNQDNNKEVIELKQKIEKLKQGFDSLNAQLENTSNASINIAKQQLIIAKHKLDSLNKTK